MAGWTVEFNATPVNGILVSLSEELAGHEEVFINIANVAANRTLISTDKDVTIKWDTAQIYKGLCPGAHYSKDWLKCIIYNKCYETLRGTDFTQNYTEEAIDTILAAVCSAGGVTAGTSPVSDLDADASSGQKVVSVDDVSLFTVGDQVKIRDDSASEINEIASISVPANDLTMVNNLANTYTVAANAKVAIAISVRFEKADCLDVATFLAKAVNKDYWASDTTFNIGIRGSNKGTLSKYTISDRAIDRSKKFDKVFVRGADADGNVLYGEAGTGSHVKTFSERKAADQKTLDQIAARYLAEFNQESTGTVLTEVPMTEAYNKYAGDTITVNDTELGLSGSYRIWKTTKKLAFADIEIDRAEALLMKYVEEQKNLEDLGIYIVTSDQLDNPPGPPTAPTNLASSSVVEGILVSWDANSEADLDRYIVFRGTAPNPTTEYAKADLNVFVDRNVSYGTTYYYRVKAVDRVGNESGYSLNTSTTARKVDTADLEDLAVTELKLAALAVTNAKIAVDAIYGAVILAGAITETKIGTDAVTTPKILAGSVTTVKLNALCVTAEKIAALAVTTPKLNAGAVTSAKITGGQIVGKDFRTATDVGEVGGPAGIRLISSELAGYSGGTTKQFYIQSADGKFYAAGGDIIIDGSGITVIDERLIFKEGVNTVATMKAEPTSLRIHSTLASTYLWLSGFPEGVDFDCDPVTLSLALNPTRFEPDGNEVAYRPDTAGKGYVGTSLYPLKEVRANDLYGTAHYADVCFQEKSCPKCELPFKIGERIGLATIKIDEDEIRTIPAHIKCPFWSSLFRRIRNGLRLD